ncbi:NAD(P)/FAD-dependent oxidoreductase [uncultured Meiothermus sp.]|uniref:phytoene desaturase family protein n=1 Tax=uncultured Meiothermus sp. TaxID=157471 RepID=UPI002624CFCB|nr:NAD(P)/FAD-dependent oxidoreductase [uncultured Meiothermus sp.]
MPDFDVVVVGAGHNALVTAAYLAQAGYRVGVFERRKVPGGAVSTIDFEGFRFDLGGSAHILIRLTPIVDELELYKHGLEYIELDPIFHASNGQESWFVWRDPGRTAAELDEQYPGQGEAYRRFYAEWLPFAKAVRETFLSTPSPLNLGQKLLLGSGLGRDWQKRLPQILRPYGDVAREYFSEERVRSPLVWMAAQSGPPPSDPLSAPFLLWHPLYHVGGVARPRGGSGGLSLALVRAIEARGGQVHLDSPVQEIKISGDKAVGIRLLDGQSVSARAVVSGSHIQKTLAMLPADKTPEGAKGLRVGNGFGLILRLGLSDKVRYQTHPGDASRIGLGLLITSELQLNRAYGDYLAGEPTRDPPLIAMSFSAVDNTLAPPGGETLWLWAQYYPHRLASGTWETRAAEAREGVIRSFERFDPDIRRKIVAELVQTPLWLENEFAMPAGNVMHLEMSLDQMFMLRPWLGAHNYRFSGLKGLYLTGASTHPGGGIMGASGRNAARVLLKDLSRNRV